MFKKYPKIHNSYSNKELNRWLEYYPALVNEQYICQEKLHGSNIQIAINPDGDYIIGSRNQQLGKNNKFQGVNIYEFINDKYPKFLEYLKQGAKHEEQIIRVYGELCGPKIQKGVEYGSEIFVKIFDMTIGDKLITQRYLQELLNTDDLLVPVISYHNNIWDAFNQDINIVSKLNHIEGNIIEGIVIKPFNKVYTSTIGKIFYWKKKNEKFKEKKQSTKSQITDTNLIRLNKEFKSYLTENRLHNIFSKYGEIESPEQIGEYIKYMMIDAKEDFNEDFGEEVRKYEGKELKFIYKDNGIVVKMLKEYL